MLSVERPEAQPSSGWLQNLWGCVSSDIHQSQGNPFWGSAPLEPKELPGTQSVAVLRKQRCCAVPIADPAHSSNAWCHTASAVTPHSCITPSLCFSLLLGCKKLAVTQKSHWLKIHSLGMVFLQILLRQTWGSVFFNKVHNWILWSGGGNQYFGHWVNTFEFFTGLKIYCLATPIPIMCKCFLY